MQNKVNLVFSELEFEIFYSDSISFFEPKFPQQFYSALFFYVVVQVSD